MKFAVTIRRVVHYKLIISFSPGDEGWSVVFGVRIDHEYVDYSYYVDPVESVE